MFWERVKDELDYQKISQKELAERLGMNIGSLRNSMSLGRLPDLETAYKIAQSLNQSLEFFLGGDIFEPNNYHLPTRETALLQNYRKLSDNEKNAVDSVAEILSAGKENNNGE